MKTPRKAPNNSTRREQLPYLLDLLDDETPVVRENVTYALEAYGTSLEYCLSQLNIPLTDIQQSVLEPVLRKQRMQSVGHSWLSWRKIRGEKEKLERAMILIAELQSGRMESTRIPLMLDSLVEEFREQHKEINALTLARFLFKEVALKGASTEEYFSPHNSNLVHVITHKTGIPISLAVIYILTGYRLNLKIEGCNLPGHFLAIADVNGKTVVVDCFNDGRLIRKEHLQEINAAITLNDILKLECRSKEIVARVLRNLIHAYQQAGDYPMAKFLAELLQSPGEGIHAS